MNGYESPVVTAMITLARRRLALLLLPLLAVLLGILVGTHAVTVEQVLDHLTGLLLAVVLSVLGVRP